MREPQPKLYPQYERLLRNGEYDSVEELCNALALNYDDVYDYDTYGEEMDKYMGGGEDKHHSRRRR